MVAISVLTTTYNHEQFILDCLKSIQDQTFKDYEHVIVDDGSTDRTGNIIKKLAENDEHIVYIPQVHVGPFRLAETYNRGLKACSGRFISIVEGDDYVPSNRLVGQLQGMERCPNAVLGFGRICKVNASHEILGVFPNPKQFKNRTDWLTPLIVHDYITALSTIIKVDSLREIGGFQSAENCIAVDYATFLELALKGPFTFIDQVLGFWVKHEGNYSDRNLYYTVENQYGVEFCRKHGLTVPWKAINRQKGKDLFHIGRHKLLEGNRPEANRLFKEAYGKSGSVGKAKCVTGLLLSYAGLDFEKLAKIARRPREQ